MRLEHLTSSLIPYLGQIGNKILDFNVFVALTYLKKNQTTNCRLKDQFKEYK